MSMQEDRRAPVGARVRVHCDLNDGRYNGRLGTVAEHYEARGGPADGALRLVVQLDEWTPGLETGDGRLYLNAGECSLDADSTERAS